MIQKDMDKRDKLDDYTARALLLPKEMFCNDLHAYKYFKTKSKWKRVRIAEKLAKKYGVDVLVVWKRIKEIQMLYSI